jgi:hypothetical protein
MMFVTRPAHANSSQHTLVLQKKTAPPRLASSQPCCIQQPHDIATLPSLLSHLNLAQASYVDPNSMLLAQQPYQRASQHAIVADAAMLLALAPSSIPHISPRLQHGMHHTTRCSCTKTMRRSMQTRAYHSQHIAPSCVSAARQARQGVPLHLQSATPRLLGSKVAAMQN